MINMSYAFKNIGCLSFGFKLTNIKKNHPKKGAKKNQHLSVNAPLYNDYNAFAKDLAPQSAGDTATKVTFSPSPLVGSIGSFRPWMMKHDMRCSWPRWRGYGADGDWDAPLGCLLFVGWGSISKYIPGMTNCRSFRVGDWKPGNRKKSF